MRSLKINTLVYSPPAYNGLDLLYEDEYLLVINKPAGLLSVPGRGEEKQDCLISRVQMTYPSALIVHRLDMATSGILVLALDKDIHRLLSQQFQQRVISKRYVAVVAGKLTQEQGRIDVPLICDWPNRPKQMVDVENGKQAQTDYTLLEFDSARQTSRLELMPITGRTHQLRLHCQYMGHPILGDELYADPQSISMSSRLLLHAASIGFKHPVSDELVSISSDIPF